MVRSRQDHARRRRHPPRELENLLRDQLTPNEARKISVIVMDVTKPGDQPAERADRLD